MEKNDKLLDMIEHKQTSQLGTKSSKYSVFLLSLSLYCTSIPPKYSIFIQQLNLFHFRKIFPKNPGGRLEALS